MRQVPQTLLQVSNTTPNVCHSMTQAETDDPKPANCLLQVSNNAFKQHMRSAATCIQICTPSLDTYRIHTLGTNLVR